MASLTLHSIAYPTSTRAHQAASFKAPAAMLTSFTKPASISARLTSNWVLKSHRSCRLTAQVTPRRSSANRKNRLVTFAGWNDFEWSEVKIASKSKAAEELFNITLDVGEEAVKGYTKPGQFVQLRTSAEGKAAFIALACPPGSGGSTLDLLVKPVEGSTTQDICDLQPGASLEMSPVMGKGFDMSKAPTDSVGTIIIFATGSGISPIKALIEAPAELGGLDATSREEVRLYYGAKNEDFMAFTERFADWTERGVTVVPVYSQTEGSKYVQDAFKDAAVEMDLAAAETAVVLCGQKEMAQAVTDIVSGMGVAEDKLLTNF